MTTTLDRERYLIVFAGVDEISVKLSYDGKGVLRGTETYSGIPDTQYWKLNYPEMPITKVIKESTHFSMPNGVFKVHLKSDNMPYATEYVGGHTDQKALGLKEVRQLD